MELGARLDFKHPAHGGKFSGVHWNPTLAGYGWGPGQFRQVQHVRFEADWLEAQIVAIDALLQPIELIPIAQLVLALHGVGVLREKCGPLDPPVPPGFRCAHCKSPRTRFKGMKPLTHGLEPIRGVELRCRICGGTTRFAVESPASLEVDVITRP